MDVQYFNHLVVPVPKKEIYSRLGYAQGITQLTDSERKKIEKVIQQALDYIELKAAVVRVPKEDIFQSQSLNQLLKDSLEMLVIAATASSAIMEAIAQNIREQNLTVATIFDAVASEMVDDALTWVINYLNVKLRRESKIVTPRRFSCGYGDFDLKYQKDIYRLLSLEKLRITITDNYMLIPEKSVTAVAGIIKL